MTRQRLSTLLWSLAAVAVAIAGIAWFTPSSDYLYVPNAATPLARRRVITSASPLSFCQQDIESCYRRAEIATEGGSDQ